MEEQDKKKFSWTDLFLVTSGCFFLFSIYLSFVEVTKPGIFLWIALGTLFLGILSATANIVISPQQDNQSE